MVKKTLAKRIAIDAVLAAASLIVFTVESLLPPLLLPGAKIGLSNIFSLLALLLFGYFDGLAVLLTRLLLGSVITGTVSSLIYGLIAGLISLTVSFVLIRFAYPNVSIVAISVTAAVTHNVIQALSFVLFNGAPQMLAYMPYLALIGTASGLFVGFVVFVLDRSLPDKITDRKGE